MNIPGFCKEFNARTAKQEGYIIPVVITVYSDRSFTFITKTPPAAVLIKKECNIESGSGVPNKTKVATISKASVQKIAELKMRDLNAASLEAAMSMIAGTARSMGVKEGRIAFKHILPNVISVILVSVTLDFAGCMLTESSLSYLGFGVQLPRPTWGNMLDGSRNALVIQSYWWRWVFPALFLSIVVICINIIGDTLREVLDPKSEVDK